MHTCNDLLQNNKQWSAQLKKKDRTLFEQLSKKQTPKFLWIGCSDSRVPAEIIVNAEPGDMFIHRNIANQVIHTDFNCLSVLQYAVRILEIKHIIVCGHYGCGGIMAALNKQRSDLVITNKWLMHIKNTYRLHQQEIDSFATEVEQGNRLVELNVIEQIHALSHTSIVQEAWKNHQRPILHGWVYGLNDGLIDPLITLKPNDPINPIFQYQDVSTT